MPSKRCLEQLKSARAVHQSLKKRKPEASLVLNSEIDNDKLSTADKSDAEGESGTWFWNESADESDSDTEEEGEVDEDGSDLYVEESGSGRAVSPEVEKRGIKWGKEGKDRLRGVYGNSSRSTSRRERKSARELWN